MKKTLLNILFSTSLISTNVLANQIMLLGELDHRNSQYRIDTKNFINQNSNNYNILALEAFESNKQYLLDNYHLFPTKQNLTKINDYLSTRWKYYDPKSYTNLIEFTYSNNMLVVGIDEPKYLQKKETKLLPVPPEFSKTRISREKHMAKILCDLSLENNILVLIGNIHTNKKFLPLQIKKTCSKTINTKTLK